MVSIIIKVLQAGHTQLGHYRTNTGTTVRTKVFHRMIDSVYTQGYSQDKGGRDVYMYVSTQKMKHGSKID